MTYFVFFAPQLEKHHHTDFCKSFKTLRAAKKYVADDIAYFKSLGEKRWTPQSYFIAKRMK